MIPLPGRALCATVRRTMSIDHPLSDVSSNNLCRFPRCGFPGCEPNVLKHLCIPTEFLWHPSHCSDLLNSSLKVHTKCVSSISLLPTQMPPARFPFAATRRHSCRDPVPQLFTISAVSPLYSRPKMSLYDDLPRDPGWKRVIIPPTEFTRNGTIGSPGRNSRPFFAQTSTCTFATTCR